ncbi:MAG: type II toxin-antitoxin system VapC family toxin [Oxalobacteraceae bacterium]
MLVDTNVLVDVLQDDPEWAEWSVNQLRIQSQIHRLIVNPIIYAELSVTFATIEALDRVLKQMELDLVELPKPALFLAGQAFLKYRRAGGTKTNVLSDFFIGAHAAVMRVPVLTRDLTRYRRYFPGLQLICP